MQPINNISKKIILLALIFCVALACGCTQVNDNNSSIADSSLVTESSSDFLERDGKLAEFVTITTDKTEYSIDENLTVIITAICEDGEEGYFGQDFYIEYYKDGEWKRCEKEFEVLDEALCFGGTTSSSNAKFTFKLAERIDEGYEKYRIVSDSFFTSLHRNATLYTNEFTLKE